MAVSLATGANNSRATVNNRICPPRSAVVGRLCRPLGRPTSADPGRPHLCRQTPRNAVSAVLGSRAPSAGFGYFRAGIIGRVGFQMFIDWRRIARRRCQGRGGGTMRFTSKVTASKQVLSPWGIYVYLHLFSRPFATASLSAPGVECTLSPELECVGNPGLNCILSNSARTVAPTPPSAPSSAPLTLLPRPSTVTNGCADVRRFSEAFASISLTTAGTQCTVFKDSDCAGASAFVEDASVSVDLGAVGLSNIGSFSFHQCSRTMLLECWKWMEMVSMPVGSILNRRAFFQIHISSFGETSERWSDMEPEIRTAKIGYTQIHKKPGDPKCQEIGHQDIRIVCESATRGAIEMLHGRKAVEELVG
ncbi:hypothetical protein B0H14DRAFT_2573264 [Mycena olivaceomarginata]|nr:hypothetical protein B0H14DRAFT_2573264 [Mycena olivaceomarginata]